MRFSLFIVIFFANLLFAGDSFAVDAPFVEGSIKMFSVLFIIVFLLVLLAWGLKRYGPVAKAKKALGLDILGQIALNTKASLALVRVGKSLLLIGVTYNSIVLIKDLSRDKFDDTISMVGMDDKHET
ncbi:MAG: flagellar biosynthetic protein FliO [Deltaproteobacteria bacterium]|nr:flagellar biosynthetic protein FliO [Deltaproteobacteria bacterium]